MKLDSTLTTYLGYGAGFLELRLLSKFADGMKRRERVNLKWRIYIRPKWKLRLIRLMLASAMFRRIRPVINTCTIGLYPRSTGIYR